MRFNLLPIFLGHWRGLTNVDSTGSISGPDLLSRIILVGASGTAAGLVFGYKVSLAAPTALLSGFALLSGVLLGVFAQMASMRIRLTDHEDESNRRRVLKDSLDESVSHVLVAALLGIVTSAVIVISMAVQHPATPAQPEICGVGAVVVAFLGVYEALLLLLVIARLYSAYTRVNDVDDALNGHKARK